MAKRIIEDIDPTSELETSWVRRGANPMSKVFLKKTADPLQPETTNMALKSVVLAGLMTSVAGAALAKSFTTDAELDAFVAKTDAEQTADLAAFAKAKGMPFGDAEDAKDGGKDDDKEDKNGKVVKADAVTEDAIAKALENSPILKAMRDENAALKASLEKAVTDTVEVSLRKRAETEFKGLGLGVEKTVAVLKGLDSLAADVRGDIESVFKSHAKLAALIAPQVGLTALAKDADSATAKLTKMAEDLAKDGKISFAEAFVKVNDDPANYALVEKADEEEREALAA